MSMKHLAAATTRRIDSLNDLIGKSVAWLTATMVLTMFAIVVLRYGFNIGWIAMQESITYMHTCVFLLGAAYTLRHDGHVRVDIFYRKANGRFRAIVNLAGSLLFLLPMSIFIFWVSWDYVSSSWLLSEGSREAGGLPGVYLLKSTILLMASTICLQGFSIILKSLLILSGDASEEDHT